MMDVKHADQQDLQGQPCANQHGRKDQLAQEAGAANGEFRRRLAQLGELVCDGSVFNLFPGHGPVLCCGLRPPACTVAPLRMIATPGAECQKPAIVLLRDSWRTTLKQLSRW